MPQKRRTHRRWRGGKLTPWIAAVLLASTAHAQPPEGAAGKAVFAANCALCHSAEAGDGGGGMGPNLHNIFDRAAGSGDANFPYTAALQGSKLSWNGDTLDQFLAAPSKVVPGTAMSVAVADKAERAALVAYFRSLATTARRP